MAHFHTHTLFLTHSCVCTSMPAGWMEKQGIQRLQQRLMQRWMVTWIWCPQRRWRWVVKFWMYSDTNNRNTSREGHTERQRGMENDSKVGFGQSQLGQLSCLRQRKRRLPWNESGDAGAYGGPHAEPLVSEKPGALVEVDEGAWRRSRTEICTWVSEVSTSDLKLSK